MSDNLDIIMYDFENICRTCLSKKDLKPLYEKCSWSTCLADMLMYFTFVKFTEDDGLPVNICANCIHKINQIVEPIIKIEEDMQNVQQTRDYEYAKEVEEEVDLKIEHEDYVVQVEEVKIECDGYVEEEAVKIENEFSETYHNPADESYKEDIDENQCETYSDNSGSRPRRSSTNSHIEEECLDVKDGYSAKQQDEILHLPNVCSVCSKVFAQPNNLKIHMRTHTGEKPYTCRVCNRAFTQPSPAHQTENSYEDTQGKSPIPAKFAVKLLPCLIYSKFMRLHTGEKPYTCKICNKSFAQINSLKNHMRIHTGDKPYICEVCSKAFSRPHSLKIHMRIHTGDKPYICGVCSKAFTHHSNLKFHMRIHTGEKPYICSICSKAYTDRSSLRYHMRIHTQDKPFPCDVCGKKYSSKWYLIIHKQKFHEEI